MRASRSGILIVKSVYVALFIMWRLVPFLDDLQVAAEQLYQHIDNMELYVVGSWMLAAEF